MSIENFDEGEESACFVDFLVPDSEDKSSEMETARVKQEAKHITEFLVEEGAPISPLPGLLSPSNSRDHALELLRAQIADAVYYDFDAIRAKTYPGIDQGAIHPFFLIRVAFEIASSYSDFL